MRTYCVPAIVLTLVLISAAGCSQPACQSDGVASLLGSLPGDWVGTVSQSTDGKLIDTRYFHAVTKQSGSDTYETTFTYYRIDPKTGGPVPAGECGMSTKIDAAGAATNSVTGKGDILVDANTWKSETHTLTETLRVCPAGGLQGTGCGSISITGMPLGLGKNGAVKDFSSAWSVSGDTLKISQRFSVVFVVLLCRKSYAVTAEYTATRGADVIGLMKNAQTGPGS